MAETWAVPQEVYTDELSQQKSPRPPRFHSASPAQFTQEQSLELVKKARASGITPSCKAWATATILALMFSPRRCSTELRALELLQTLPRTFVICRSARCGGLHLDEAAAWKCRLPQNFMTLKLAESHFHFYQKPGALMLPMGKLVHGPRLCAGGRRRAAGGFSSRHHAISRYGRRGLQ